MAEYLVIRLGTDADDPVDWIAVDSDGTRLGPPVTGPLAAAAGDVGDRRVIVLVPGADVLTTTVDIPVKGARLLAALPYALEESVAEDVDHLHFAAGTRRDDERVPVAAVRTEQLDEWLERLSTAGIHADRVLPEQYGLARIPGTSSLLLLGDDIVANDGRHTDILLQDVSPGDVLVALGVLDAHDAGSDDDSHEDDAENRDAPPRHVLVYCEARDDERYRHDWMALRNELDSLDVKLLPDGPLPRLAATVATGTGVNLLQGRYGPRKEYSSVFAPWKYAAMLLLALVVVGTAGKAAHHVALSREEAALREQFQAAYEQVAPGAAEVEDPVRLVASLRARAGGGNGTPAVLLQALEQLSNAMASGTDVNIEAISFRAGVADVRLNAASVSVLDNVRQRIEQGGVFRARIQSTDQVGERVNSRLQIQVADQ